MGSNRHRRCGRGAGLGESWTVLVCSGETLGLDVTSPSPLLLQATRTANRPSKAIRLTDLVIDFRMMESSDFNKNCTSSMNRHRVRSDFLCRVEVLGQKATGHDERFARVGESFARRTIHGKFPRRVQRDHTCQVAQGVGVFRIR